MIAARFGLHLVLMLLFGIAAYPFHAGRRQAAPRRVMIALAAGGVAASIAAFTLSVAAMGGTTLSGIDPATARMILFETPPGTAFALRTGALALLAALVTAGRGGAAAWALCAGAALSTLAWSGHAAATEGVAGTVHRMSDSLHLLAAGGWIGALAMLLAALFRPASRGDAALDALSAFSGAGTALVAIVAVTGAVNLWLIASGSDGVALPAGEYARLLVAKLGLFAGMLAFAALNRWRLVPRLAAAATPVARTRALRTLRSAIAVEAAAGVAILALVAMLGMGDPH